MGLHAGRRRSKRAARLQRADLRARDGNNGRYYPQADARLANNPDLAPGINCCAVCARQFITKVCPVSRRVRYCSAHHMLLDAKACVEINQCVGCDSSLSHFSAMTRPSWLGRAMRNRHRHALELASRRWRGDDATIQHERAVKF